jgi:hypothetical protein
MQQLKEWLPDEVIAYMQAHLLLSDI